jgi:hypothetical protein
MPIALCAMPTLLAPRRLNFVGFGVWIALRAMPTLAREKHAHQNGAPGSYPDRARMMRDNSE